MPCSVETSMSSSGQRGKSPTRVASGRRSGTTTARTVTSRTTSPESSIIRHLHRPHPAPPDQAFHDRAPRPSPPSSTGGQPTWGGRSPRHIVGRGLLNTLGVVRLEVELVSADPGKERGPLVWGEHQCRALTVLAGSYRDDAGQIAGDLYTTSVTATKGAGAPLGAAQIMPCLRLLSLEVVGSRRD